MTGNDCRTRETFIDGYVHNLFLWGGFRGQHNLSLPRWMRTGDEVIFDKSGDLFIVDRIKVFNQIFFFFFYLFFTTWLNQFFLFVPGIDKSERKPSGTCRT